MLCETLLRILLHSNVLFRKAGARFRHHGRSALLSYP